MYYDLECPYCEKGLIIDHSDGFGYQENVLHQMQCDHCGQGFVFSTSISFDFEPHQADCLNGSDHDFKSQVCIPKEYTRMECTMCGELRDPSEEEMKIIMNSKNNEQ